MLVHALGARIFPELAIREDEAFELAKAYVGWRKHYSDVSIVDPKTEALFAFLVVLAVVEGPRISRVTTRRAAQKSAAKIAKAAQDAMGAVPNVVPFHGVT